MSAVLIGHSVWIMPLASTLKGPTCVFVIKDSQGTAFKTVQVTLLCSRQSDMAYYKFIFRC